MPVGSVRTLCVAWSISVSEAFPESSTITGSAARAAVAQARQPASRVSEGQGGQGPAQGGKGRDRHDVRAEYGPERLGGRRAGHAMGQAPRGGTSHAINARWRARDDRGRPARAAPLRAADTRPTRGCGSIAGDRAGTAPRVRRRSTARQRIGNMVRESQGTERVGQADGVRQAQDVVQDVAQETVPMAPLRGDAEDGLAARQATARLSTLVSVAVNSVLSVVQIVAGLLSGSSGLVADGVHTLSDLVADFVVLFAGHRGGKAPDEDHHYGHQRYENAASLALGLLLLAVGIGMLWSAAHSCSTPRTSARHPVALWWRWPRWWPGIAVPLHAGGGAAGALQHAGGQRLARALGRRLLPWWSRAASAAICLATTCSIRWRPSWWA